MPVQPAWFYNIEFVLLLFYMSQFISIPTGYTKVRRKFFFIVFRILNFTGPLIQFISILIGVAYLNMIFMIF